VVSLLIIQRHPGLRTFITKESVKRIGYPSFPVCIHVSTGKRPWCHRTRFSGVIEVSKEDISEYGHRVRLSDILPPLKGVGFPICRRSSWCFILSSSGLCQSSPCHGDIPHGSFFCLLELPLPFRYGALFQPLDIHTTSEQTRSKEYYSRAYLSAFIPPLKGVGFLRYSCKSIVVYSQRICPLFFC
jgi:hypothetical protein